MSIGSKITDYKNKLLDNGSLTVKEQLGYSAGIFGNCMGQDSAHTYADIFSRDFMGLSPRMLTVNANIGTILGFFIPPIAGAYFDSKGKPGKASNIRRALFFTPIPFAITSMMLFIVPSTSIIFNFIYVLFAGFLFGLVDTFYDMAMSTLALRLVRNPKDRSNFYTFSSIASTFGSMLPGWLIPIVVDTTDDAKRQQWLYFFVALGFCIIGVAVMFAPYLTIQDRAELGMLSLEESQEKNKEKIIWDKKTLNVILHNKPFIITEISLLCDMVRQVTYKILPYIYKDTFNFYGMKAIIDAISGALSYVGLFAVPFVGKKIAAHTMLAGGYLYTTVFYAIMSFFNIGFPKAGPGMDKSVYSIKSKNWITGIRKKKWIIGILIGLGGMPNAAQGAARKIVVADSIDYMEWYSLKKYDESVRSEGMIAAAQNIISRGIDMIKTNLYNILFEVIGYVSKSVNSNKVVVQSDKTLNGIYKIFSLCGLIGNGLSALCFILYDFKGKKREKIYKELEEMRAKSNITA